MASGFMYIYIRTNARDNDSIYILYIVLDVISDYDTCVCIYNIGNGILYMTRLSFGTIERVINIQDLSTSHEIGKNYLETWTFYLLISNVRLGVPNYIFGNKLSRKIWLRFVDWENKTSEESDALCECAQLPDSKRIVNNN